MQDPRSEQLGMSRREALKALIALLGGTAAAGGMPTLVYAAGDSPRVLSDEQLAVLKHAVDVIMPDTDTPGAVKAGVPELIDSMLNDVATPERRDGFIDILGKVDAMAREMHGAGLADLDAGQRYAVVDRCDELAFGETEDDRWFRPMKQATLFGYYTSEIGASVELRFDPVPGPFQGKVTLEEVGRTLYKHGR